MGGPSGAHTHRHLEIELQSGAEAQLGTYKSPKGPMTLAIFNYPTPQIAMQKEVDFRALPGGPMVKRAGPLVAVVLGPSDPDSAERLLAQVRYQASVTRSEQR